MLMTPFLTNDDEKHDEWEMLLLHTARKFVTSAHAQFLICRTRVHGFPFLLSRLHFFSVYKLRLYRTLACLPRGCLGFEVLWALKMSKLWSCLGFEVV
eukprot:6201690-Pleurochrysis_carterae.AAC.1